MKTATPPLLPVLRSRVQGELLALLLLDPESESTVSELADRVGTSVATVVREVDRAERVGIVQSRRLGPARLVRANPESRFYRPLSELIAMSFGPPEVLREELAEVDGVEEAYVFGSWAARLSGVPGPDPNDVDLLVVGRPERSAVYDAAERARHRIGKDVQVVFRTPAEWEAAGEPFLRTLKSQPLVHVFSQDDSR